MSSDTLAHIMFANDAGQVISSQFINADDPRMVFDNISIEVRASDETAEEFRQRTMAAMFGTMLGH